MNLSYLIPPWKHQLSAISRAKLSTNGYGLFFEPGTGKTCTAINILRHKCAAEGRLLKTLIIGPGITVTNWCREFEMHSTIKDVTPLQGTGKKRLKTFEDVSRRTPNHVFVMNYESLLMKPLYSAIQDWRPEVIIFDESHKLKNIQAKRTKAAIKLSDLARFVLILTGTPILNTSLDLFTQFRCMDPAIFGKKLYFFRDRYFQDANAMWKGKQSYFPNWQPRPGSYEELHKKISDVSMVVKKEECLDLPPLVRQVVSVELSPEQKKLYIQMSKELVAFMDGGIATASIALVKALRLMQIASGFLTIEDEDGSSREVKMKKNPRRDAVKELLSDLTPNHKVIIWAVFKDNYETLRSVCNELKIGCVEVHGAISSKEKDLAVSRFNTEPDCRVFIGNPSAGGIGINLISASYSIFYSRSFSLEDDLQAQARNYRGGSEIHKSVTRIDICAEGTIDETVAQKLANKEKISEQILHNI